MDEFIVSRFFSLNQKNLQQRGNAISPSNIVTNHRLRGVFFVIIHTFYDDALSFYAAAFLLLFYSPF